MYQMIEKLLVAHLKNYSKEIKNKGKYFKYYNKKVLLIIFHYLAIEIMMSWGQSIKLVFYFLK